MEEIKHKVCCRCQFFDKYYTKGLKDFVGTELGWCRKNATNSGLHDTCDCFKYRARKKINIQSLLAYLNNLLVEITGIHNIIKKELEEDDRQNL